MMCTGKLGEAQVCKNCYMLIRKKKERIRFCQAMSAEASVQLSKQYEYLAALRKEIENKFTDYMTKHKLLDSSLLDNFQLIPSDDVPDDLSCSVHFSEPLRSEVCNSNARD